MLETCLNQILDDKVDKVERRQKRADAVQPAAGPSRDAQEGQPDVVRVDGPQPIEVDWGDLDRVVSNRYRDLVVV